jgi:hypothetical protein
MLFQLIQELGEERLGLWIFNKKGMELLGYGFHLGFCIFRKGTPALAAEPFAGRVEAAALGAGDRIEGF